MGFDRNAASDMAFGHKPVLLEECLTALHIKPDGVYVDGTLGRAGHSVEIAKRLTGGGRLICLDRDETAIAAAKVRLADYMDRVTLVHSNFSRLGEVLAELGVSGADGMLFDLGVSSPQLDEAQRGFSYMHDAPLDSGRERPRRGRRGAGVTGGAMGWGGGCGLDSGVCGKKPKMKLISRKPITAGEAELVYNPRARSAKLRVAEKL